MPNWCAGEVNVSGKPQDIERFCRLFIYEGQEGKKRKPCFARSFNENYGFYERIF